MIENPTSEKLKISEKRVEIMEKQIKELRMTNAILMEKGKAVSNLVKEFIEYQIELEGVNLNSKV